MADKILKGCNCCLSRNRKVKLLGERARKSYCRNCHATTIWSALSIDEAQAHFDKLAEQRGRLENFARMVLAQEMTA